MLVIQRKHWLQWKQLTLGITVLWWNCNARSRLFSLLSAQKLMIAVSASRKPSLLSRQWLSCLNFLQVSAFLPRPPDPFPCCCRQTKINAVFRCYQSQRLRPWEPTDNPSSVRWPLDFYYEKNIHFLDLFSLRPSSSNTPSWADSLWWLKCVRA